jgi:ribosome maturation protein SDO1
MVTIDKAIIAKIDKNGNHYEVLVDPEMAYDLRSGKSVSVANMLAVNEIFKDAKKSMKASELSVFNTDDVEKIAEEIVKNGEIQLTTEFRKKKIEGKKRQIADLISKSAMNPQTKLPHPLDRILNAIDSAGVDIDPFQSAETQTEKVLEKLKPIIPISMDKIELTLHIPAQYAAQAYGIIKSNIKKENWNTDGSLSVTISIPASLKDEIYGKLSSLTKGDLTVKEA